MNYAQESLKFHEQWKGKLRVVPAMPITNREELSIAYTPGVAQPCLEIQKDPALSYTLTRRWNTVAVITDGTAVLGLGDIGPEAGMPVMEGKCALFQCFGGVDAIPLCIRSKDPAEIVRTISLLAGSFGGINLEDISAPRCFVIERRLKETLDIPVFHDDQHGTAVVVLAALMNGLKIVHKRLEDVSAVINGAGAAGIAIARLLLASGIKDVILCDRKGILNPVTCVNNTDQAAMCKITNRSGRKGLLKDALIGADLFIGVSGANLVSPEMVKSMAPDPIVLAMANPTPEIFPELALAAGAKVVGTGRSDYPNQINNVLAFPGIFRGALDVRARDINEEMKLAAAAALASLVGSDLSADHIIPDPFDPRICDRVSAAVADAARKTGVNRI